MSQEPKYERLNRWRMAVVNSSLPFHTKALLVCMGIKWMNENLTCFPSQRTIATVLGCNVKTVNKHLKIAEKEGWLSVTPRGTDKGWRRNEYYGFIPAK